MMQAIKEKVCIQPGGIIEVKRPELPAGTIAEVIIIVEESTNASPEEPITSFFGKVKGCFSNGEEADMFLRSERDS